LSGSRLRNAVEGVVNVIYPSVLLISVPWSSRAPEMGIVQMHAYQNTKYLIRLLSTE